MKPLNRIQNIKTNCMEKVFSKAEELAGTLRDYVDNRIEMAKLRTAEKTSLLLSNMLAFIAVALVIFLGLTLASIGVSIGIGILIGSSWAGFLIMGAFYFLLSWICWAGRERVVRIPIMNAILRHLYPKEEDHEKV